MPCYATARVLAKQNTTEVEVPTSCASVAGALLQCRHLLAAPRGYQTRCRASPYKIECPFCVAEIEVSGEINNLVTNCPSCGQEIYVTKEDALQERRSRNKTTFIIQCPFCDQRIEVPAELDNTMAKCPSCGEELYLTKEDAVD